MKRNERIERHLAAPSHDDAGPRSGTGFETFVKPMDPKPRKTLRDLLDDEEGQAMVEMIILVALVGLTLAWATMGLPEAITRQYEMARNILASPL